jgi:hypothetical protein
VGGFKTILKKRRVVFLELETYTTVTRILTSLKIYQKEKNEEITIRTF